MPCVWITIFGMPVEPEVNMYFATVYVNASIAFETPAVDCHDCLSALTGSPANCPSSNRPAFDIMQINIRTSDSVLNRGSLQRKAGRVLLNTASNFGKAASTEV